ncbi:pirin family protein [Planococcus sp. APC 4015]|nr:pirin family protein [Planococcus sp. APC 4015]
MTRLDDDTAVTEESSASLRRTQGSIGPRALLLEARDVPLGGVRAMDVRRALPQRDLPLVGAWCFLDRFGPQDTLMRVEPHPHIGLQTVTWPLVGEVRHRDSIGSDVVVRRGALNLMTSGAGISHSEYSVGDGPIPLDALQLWVALPEDRRHGGPAFERHEELPVVTLEIEGRANVEAVVVMGEFAGVTSPATAYTPIVGAEVFLPAGARVTLPVNADWEYAIVGVDGVVDVAASVGETTSVGTGHLLYLGTSREGIEVRADSDATMFLIGGEPFADEIVMWWNFVGRSHDEIVEARDAWEAGSDRFGRVVDHGDERIPAPPLPGVRLTQRRRRI